MRWISILMWSMALFAAPETKPKDMCAPPPGGTAPSLPAKILAGQGKINFPITTSSEKAQEFFNQGVAQMHSFWAIAARRNADSKDPDADYIAGLRAVVAANPKEVEAKTYLALHLMQGFTTPDKQPKGTSMEAVTILRELVQTAPEHMGVHHYIIHG